MRVTGVNIMTQRPGPVRQDLKRLEKAAGEVVGSVFYGTLLKTMRESELKGPYGHGGRGEEVFAAQLHGVLAERMGVRTSGGLAEALYRHLAKQQSLISRQASQDSGART
jgi:Rod binding domain-containing protein